jgi:hypothetical protein
MFVLYATTISATAYQADQTGVDTNHGAEVHAQPQSQRAAPYNPSTTKTNAKGNAPAKTAEPPIPLPSEPTTGVNSTHPAAAETNQALPPAPDKTTAPRQVDASGSPLPSEHIDQAGQPPTMTDTPVTPPAPEGRDQLDSPATSEGKVVPSPHKTSTAPKSEPRTATPPATPAPPPSPGLDMTRSPWGEGPNDVR